MKILYVATVASHICQFHLPYLKACQEKGHIVHVAARDNLAEKNGLALRYVDQFHNIPFQRSPRDPQNLEAYRQLKALLSKERYDLIVCNTPMGGVLTRLAARKLRKAGTRVIYIAHGFHFYKGASKKAWLVFYPVERVMARLCDTVVTINDEDHALAQKKFPVQVARIHGVGVSQERYHPVDCDTQHTFRHAEGLSDGDYVILCTGELNKNKDQKTLISAAARLKDTIPSLKVLLAGNGPLEQELRVQIEADGLSDVVCLLGYRTDLENLLPAVNLVVSCSHREGLGLNVIEGMLCQKPVIAAINRGHVELVEQGVNGYLFQPGNAAELAQYIAGVYADRELSEQMGRAGYEKAQRYTVSSVADEVNTILWNHVDAQ